MEMLVLMLVLLLLAPGAELARKRWIGQASWEEATNWNNGAPRGCDGALIEPNQVLNIAAQANIAEISFGGDSTLIFDSFSEISFAQPPSPALSCNEVERSIKFYEAPRDDFLGVENWEYYGELDDIDILDIHRIPCKHDIMEVPAREMRAELRAPMEVGGVSYGGNHLTREGVHDWLDSPDGRNELRMLSSFALNEASYCKRRGGCECGNTASCNGTTCRSPLLCDNPVISSTMCCPFCGTLVTVPVNQDKSYRQLQLELSTILSHQTSPQNLKMGIEQGQLHLVLEQRGDYSTVAVSEVVMQRLIVSNYSTKMQIEVQRSSAPVVADPIHQTKAYTNLLVVLVCMVLCLITLGLVLLYMIRRKSPVFRSNQRNSDQLNACNAYETMEPEQHLYETIGGFRLKSSEYYNSPEYSTSSANSGGSDPKGDQLRQPCLAGECSYDKSTLTSV